MQLQLPETLPLHQVCEWLGIPADKQPDAQTLQLAEQAVKIVMQSAQPRGVYKIDTIQRQQGLCCGSLLMQGTDIEKHLHQCSHTVWLAVTVGMKIEMQTRRLGKNMALVCAVDAAAGLLVEILADRLQQEIAQTMPEWFLTDRYSPGYGDFPLETQRFVVEYLDAERKIGLTVNSGGILIPRKSITAVCGMAQYPVTGHLAGCRHCVLREKCEKRREGHYCGKKRVAE